MQGVTAKILPVLNESMAIFRHFQDSVRPSIYRVARSGGGGQRRLALLADGGDNGLSLGDPVGDPKSDWLLFCLGWCAGSKLGLNFMLSISKHTQPPILSV